jgi:uncharacterized membrane protein
MNVLDFVVVVLGLLLLMIVPGFSLSLVIFGKDKFTKSERLYISSAISIFLVIAIALLLDLVLGVDMTAENIVKSLFVVTILSLFVWILEPRNIKKLSKIRG